MITLDSAGNSLPKSTYNVRTISDADLRWALAEGWKDFKEKRGDIIFLGLLYPLIGLLSWALVLNVQLLPLFFPLVAGISILGPAVATGFYELARRRDEQIEASWTHFFDPLNGHSRAAILVLTFGLVALFVGWLAVAWGIYQVTLGRLGPVPAATFVQTLLTTRAGWEMIIFGNLAGGLLAIITLVLTLVSFPMLVDKPVDPATAVETSLRAVRANIVPVGLWGLRVALLLVLGAIPAFIGLAVVLPVLGYSTWHLYTRLVER